MTAFQKMMGGAFAIQLLLTSTVWAATAPSYLAPSNSFLYMETNTAKPNPLKGHLSQIISDAAGNVENQAALDTIAQNMESTTASISTSFHQQDGSDIFFLSVALPEEDFQALLNALGTDVTATDIGQGNMIYLSGDDFYFTYKDGNLLASNLQGVVSDLILIHTPDGINDLPDWQFLNSKSSGNEFLRVLFNFRNITEADRAAANLGDLDITDLIESEGFAIEQTDNGFKATVTVKPGNMLADSSAKTAFTPALYQKVSPDGILLYSESYNWAENLDKSMQMLSQISGDSPTAEINYVFEELRNMLLESTGLDLDQDIIPLFKNRSAIAVHDQSKLQYAPAFTLISEVRGQESNARSVLSQMNEHILTGLTESFNAQYDQEQSYREQLNEFFADDEAYTPTPLPDRNALMKKFFSSSTINVGGTTYTSITVNPDATNLLYEDITTESPSLLSEITLSSTVTNDGLLIFTTSKDLEHLLSTNGGLNQDKQWQSDFQGGSMIEVSYLNMDNLSTYIQSISTSMGADAEEIAPVMDFLKPFHGLMTKSTYDTAQGYYTGKITLNMDISALTGLVTSIQDLMKTWESENPSLNPYIKNYLELTDSSLFEYYDFNDVSNEDWFSAYVYHMANLGIMKGYSDGRFQPGQNITRAEFIKTIISAYEAQNGDNGENMIPLEGFSDIHTDDWFYSYVNQGKTLGLINGYSDGSFRPNQPITRSEAVSVLVRTWELNNYFDENSVVSFPFKDVSTTDWYYHAVWQAYTLNLINGKTPDTFAPGDYLSRAETATMISRFISSDF